MSQITSPYFANRRHVLLFQLKIKELEDGMEHEREGRLRVCICLLSRTIYLLNSYIGYTRFLAYLRIFQANLHIKFFYSISPNYLVIKVSKVSEAYKRRPGRRMIQVSLLGKSANYSRFRLWPWRSFLSVCMCSSLRKRMWPDSKSSEKNSPIYHKTFPVDWHKYRLSPFWPWPSFRCHIFDILFDLRIAKTSGRLSCKKRHSLTHLKNAVFWF